MANHELPDPPSNEFQELEEVEEREAVDHEMGRYRITPIDWEEDARLWYRLRNDKPPAERDDTDRTGPDGDCSLQG